MCRVYQEIAALKLSIYLVFARFLSDNSLCLLSVNKGKWHNYFFFFARHGADFLSKLDQYSVWSMEQRSNVLNDCFCKHWRQL